MTFTIYSLFIAIVSLMVGFRPGGGGVGYCHIWAIWVCAAVKGMAVKQFTLG